MGNRADLEALLALAFSVSGGPHIEPSALPAGNGWEDQDIVSSFQSIATGQVPETSIERHRDSLASFSPQGLIAVLPHYLRYAISAPRSEVADFVLYRLAAVDEAERYWQDRLPLFDEDKKYAICQVLRYLETQIESDQRTHAARARLFWCVRKD